MDRRSFLLASCCAAVAPARRAYAADDLAGLAARLAAEGQICAVAAATLKNGKAAQTLSVSGCGAEPGSNAIFQAASLSKPVLAYVVLRMARRGEISLDRPVSDLLPEGYLHRQNIFALKAAPVTDLVPAGILRTVTPRMLLTHSAGFPNWASTGPLTPGFAPGLRWQYSGEGYVLLQRILETLTGHPLQHLAERELFEPMGLTSTAFKLTGEIQQRLVAGSPRQLRFPYEIASSSLYTSANGYVRFLGAVLGDEEMLSLITQAPVKLPVPSLAWGLGWGIEMRERPVSIWHWGSNPGFRALAMASLESHDAIAVFTNSESGMPLAKAIVRAAMPGDHPGLDLDLVR